MENPPISVPESIQAHRAESERLGRLTEYLKEFAPAIGEAGQPGRSADDGSSVGLASSRDLAILEAHRAVERIARASFLFPTPKRKRGTP